MNLSLRDVASRLAKLLRHKSPSQFGRSELLQYLRLGKLEARFDFPSNDRPPILLESDYWKAVKPGAFNNALSRQSGRTKGDYVVPAAQFAAQYMEWFSANCDPKKHKSELVTALTSSPQPCEVYIKEIDFESFVEAEKFNISEHSNPVGKSNRGNYENRNWSAILVEVAIGLLSAPENAPRPNAAQIAMEASKRVTARGDMPKIETIADKVREILRGAKTT